MDGDVTKAPCSQSARCFLALIVSGLGVAARADPARTVTILAVLAASVACAVGWSYAFYGPHALAAAALLLAVASLLTWVMIALVWRELPWAGLVLVPYGLWMLVATSLAVGYWRLR